MQENQASSEFKAKVDSIIEGEDPLLEKLRKLSILREANLVTAQFKDARTKTGDRMAFADAALREYDALEVNDPKRMEQSRETLEKTKAKFEAEFEQKNEQEKEMNANLKYLDNFLKEYNPDVSLASNNMPIQNIVEIKETMAVSLSLNLGNTLKALRDLLHKEVVKLNTEELLVNALKNTVQNNALSTSEKLSVLNVLFSETPLEKRTSAFIALYEKEVKNMLSNLANEYIDYSRFLFSQVRRIETTDISPTLEEAERKKVEEKVVASKKDFRTDEIYEKLNHDVTSYTNVLPNYVVSTILSGDIEAAQLAIRQWLIVASHCVHKKDYLTAFAIYSGLGQSPVGRIRDKLPTFAENEIYNFLDKLFSKDKNFKNIRVRVENEAEGSFVPVLNLTIKDVTSTYEGNPNRGEAALLTNNKLNALKVKAPTLTATEKESPVPKNESMEITYYNMSLAIYPRDTEILPLIGPVLFEVSQGLVGLDNVKAVESLTELEVGKKPKLSSESKHTSSKEINSKINEIKPLLLEANAKNISAQLPEKLIELVQSLEQKLEVTKSGIDKKSDIQKNIQILRAFADELNIEIPEAAVLSDIVEVGAPIQKPESSGIFSRFAAIASAVKSIPSRISVAIRGEATPSSTPSVSTKSELPKAETVAVPAQPQPSQPEVVAPKEIAGEIPAVPAAAPPVEVRPTVIMENVTWEKYWQKFNEILGKGKEEDIDRANLAVHEKVGDALKIKISDLQEIASLDPKDFEDKVNAKVKHGEVKGPTTLQTEEQQNKSSAPAAPTRSKQDPISTEEALKSIDEVEANFFAEEKKEATSKKPDVTTASPATKAPDLAYQERDKKLWMGSSITWGQYWTICDAKFAALENAEGTDAEKSYWAHLQTCDELGITIQNLNEVDAAAVTKTNENSGGEFSIAVYKRNFMRAALSKVSPAQNVIEVDATNAAEAVVSPPSPKPLPTPPISPRAAVSAIPEVAEIMNALNGATFKNEALRAFLKNKVEGLVRDNQLSKLSRGDASKEKLITFIERDIANVTGDGNFGNYQALIKNASKAIREDVNKLFDLSEDDFYKAVDKEKPLPALSEKFEKSETVGWSREDVIEVLKKVKKTRLVGMLVDKANTGMFLGITESEQQKLQGYVEELNRAIELFGGKIPSYSWYEDFLSRMPSEDDKLKALFDVNKETYKFASNETGVWQPKDFLYAINTTPFKNEKLKEVLKARMGEMGEKNKFSVAIDTPQKEKEMQNFITTVMANMWETIERGEYDSQLASAPPSILSAVKAVFELSEKEFYNAKGQDKPLPQPPEKTVSSSESTEEETLDESTLLSPLNELRNPDLKGMILRVAEDNLHNVGRTGTTSEEVQSNLRKAVNALNEKFGFRFPSYSEYSSFIEDFSSDHSFLLEISEGFYKDYADLVTMHPDDMLKIGACCDVLDNLKNIQKISEDYAANLNNALEAKISKEDFDVMQKQAMGAYLEQFKLSLIEAGLTEQNALGLFESVRMFFDASLSDNREVALQDLSAVLETVKNNMVERLNNFSPFVYLAPFIENPDGVEPTVLKQQLGEIIIRSLYEGTEWSENSEKSEVPSAGNVEITGAINSLRQTAQQMKTVPEVESSPALMEEVAPAKTKETGSPQSRPKILARLAEKISEARENIREKREDKKLRKLSTLEQLEKLAENDKLTESQLNHVNDLLSKLEAETTKDRESRPDLVLYYPVEKMGRIVTALAKHYQTQWLNIAAIQAMFPPQADVDAYLKAEEAKLDEIIDSLPAEDFEHIFDEYFQPTTAENKRLYDNFYSTMDVAKKQAPGTYQAQVENYTFRDILKKSFAITSESQGGQSGSMRDQPACDAAEKFLKENKRDTAETKVIETLIKARSVLSELAVTLSAAGAPKAISRDAILDADESTISQAIDMLHRPQGIIREYQSESAQIAPAMTGYLGSKDIQNEVLRDALTTVMNAGHFDDDAQDVDELSPEFVAAANKLIKHDSEMPTAFLQNYDKFMVLVEKEITQTQKKYDARVALIKAVVKGDIKYEVDPVDKSFQSLDTSLLNAKTYQAELRKAIKVVQRKLAGKALLEIQGLEAEKALVDIHVAQLSSQLKQAPGGRLDVEAKKAAELQRESAAAERSMLDALADFEKTTGESRTWTPPKLRKKSTDKSQPSSNEEVLGDIKNPILREAMVFAADRKGINLRTVDPSVINAAVTNINAEIPPGRNVMPNEFLGKYAKFLSYVKDIPGINDLRSEFIIAVVTQNKSPIQEKDFGRNLDDANSYDQVNLVRDEIGQARKETDNYAADVLSARTALQDVLEEDSEEIKSLDAEFKRLTTLSSTYARQYDKATEKAEEVVLREKLQLANNRELLAQVAQEIDNKLAVADEKIVALEKEILALATDTRADSRHKEMRLDVEKERWHALRDVYKKLESDVQAKMKKMPKVAASKETESTKVETIHITMTLESSITTKEEAKPGKRAKVETGKLDAVIVYHPDETDIARRFERVSGKAEMKKALNSDNHMIEVKDNSVSYTQPKEAEKLSDIQMKEVVQKMVEETFAKFKPTNWDEITYEGSKKLKDMARECMKAEIAKHAPIETARIAGEPPVKKAKIDNQGPKPT